MGDEFPLHINAYVLELRHFQSQRVPRKRDNRYETKSESPERGEVYEEAQIQNFRRSRSKSRPRVRREHDFEPIEIMERKEGTLARSRSLTRSQSVKRMTFCKTSKLRQELLLKPFYQTRLREDRQREISQKLFNIVKLRGRFTPTLS